jgi:hypothetical protein
LEDELETPAAELPDEQAELSPGVALSATFESFVNKLSNFEAKLATVLGANLTDLLTSIGWLLCPLMGLLVGLCLTNGLMGSKLGRVDSDPLHDSSSDVSVSEHLSLVFSPLAFPESPLVLSFLN